MSITNKISLLYPNIDYTSGEDTGFLPIGEEAAHNLGLDKVVNNLSDSESERAYIMRVLSHMTSSPEVAEYRAEVFEDILRFPNLRKEIMAILDKINFLKDYGSFKKDHDEAASAFELIHRLEEINDYIICVEAIQECLSGCDIQSRGLKNLKEHVETIYKDHAFGELKNDIGGLRASTSELKSVTLGINLNNRFEAESIGLVSVNNKKFTKSGVIGSFSDAITAKKGGVKDGNEWKEDYHYQPFSASSDDIKSVVSRFVKFQTIGASPFAYITMSSIAQGDPTSEVTRYMDGVVNHMLYLTVKKLKEVLNKYVNITITEITDLIPEFMYYIRWAEYIETMKEAGYVFNRAKAVSGDTTSAVGIYSLLLAQSHIDDKIDIVVNDLKFDPEHSVYILTGANRGGKTTITVAVGLLYVLAQGGIYIPGSSFEYVPVDCIYTHFPADEDKTMDLGRLGEECIRFKELYDKATEHSLILLNETFSTTSFEEGYYIARDAVRAILNKGSRTIYNTHMHKLARELDEINASVEPLSKGDTDASGENYGDSHNSIVDLAGSKVQVDGTGEISGNQHKAQSLIVCSEGGNRSFKIAVAPPEGMSYAEDIARKYGVTYDSLTGN